MLGPQALGLRLDRSGLRAGHRALPLEDDALLNDEARRRDVAEDLARRPDLQAFARCDVARHLAVHHDRGPGDVRVDDRALADGECVLRGDFALYLALDADRPLEGELAGDPATLAEERAGSARLVHLGRLVALEHLPLPWRRIPGRHRGGPGTESPRPIAPLTVLAE